MKSLVTGGAGFIGSHVADCLEASGHEVVVLDDLSGGFAHNVPEGRRFVEGSVMDRDLVNKLFETERFDYVFHFAAYAPEALSHFIRGFNYENNLLGSINVINAAINAGTVRGFVFTSSIAAYGHLDAAASEADACAPVDPYGVAKLAIEHDLRAANDMFGLPFIVFRPHNVYGPRQNLSDPFRNVVGIFFNKAMKGESMPVFGDGQQTRAFSYIDDVAPVIANSINVEAAYGKAFNIGGRTSYTIQEIAEKVSSALRVDSNIEYLPPRHELKHAWADHTLLDEVFGVPVQTPLEIGIKDMATWAEGMGAQDSVVFRPRVDVIRKMPDRYAEILGINPAV